MKITRTKLKETLRTIMKEEAGYTAFFKKALKKTGKSIPEMSEEEKKVFFNKIDAAWDSKGEQNESLTTKQKQLDIDGDGEISADDLKDLRAGKTIDDDLVNEKTTKNPHVFVDGKFSKVIDKLPNSKLTKDTVLKLAKKFKVDPKDAIAFVEYDRVVDLDESEVNESFMADLDIIKQSSKSLSDFVKKVLNNSDYKEVRSDKDFHKYLKAVYTENIEEGDGLWANIRAKKARGGKPAHKNSKAHKDAVKAGNKINKSESTNEASFPNADPKYFPNKFNSKNRYSVMVGTKNDILAVSDTKSTGSWATTYNVYTKQGKFIGSANSIKQGERAFKKTKINKDQLTSAKSFSELVSKLSESTISEATSEKDVHYANEFFKSKSGILLDKQFKGKYNKSVFNKLIDGILKKSNRHESIIKVWCSMLDMSHKEYLGGEIIEDGDFIRDAGNKIDKLYTIFKSQNENVNEARLGKVNLLKHIEQGKTNTIEGVTISEELAFELRMFLQRPMIARSRTGILIDNTKMQDALGMLKKAGITKRLTKSVKGEFDTLVSKYK